MAARTEPPIRILVIRLSAIGDVIMASGLIPALHEAFPNARIDWLTEEANADLLRHNPRLDRLHLLSRWRWRDLRRAGRYRQFLREAFEVIRALRAERYDLVLDLQGLLKSGVWAALSGGGRRIGLGSREGSGLLMTEVLDRHVVSPKIGKEYRKLAEFLGAPPEAFELDIAVSDEDRAAAAELLRTASVVGNYAVIAPFTTRPQKHWFDERWAELAAGLAAGWNWPVVMLGGPGDRERAEAICALSGDGLVNLAGRTRLGQCAAVIERAKLLVGVDTGLTHLGIALRTPTLALFGSTRPYLDTGRPNARVLYEALDCSPCRRRPTCGGSFDCMRRHTAASVLGAVAELVGEPL
jgi:heptosyltransferase-1